MANITLKLKNSRNNKIKTAYLGFSWTVLLFGFFVPIIRKDWENAAIMFFFYVPTLGLASIPYAFIYNRMHTHKLFDEGYNLMYYWGPLTNAKLEKVKSQKPIEIDFNIS